MGEPVTVNPLDAHNDVIGKTFTVKQCEAREHGDNSGCVCHLIGRKVKITKQYDTPFVGTASYHIKGHNKTVRRSEIGLPNVYTNGKPMT